MRIILARVYSRRIVIADLTLQIELLLIGVLAGAAVYQRTSLIPEWAGALPDSVIRYFRGTTNAAAISRFWKLILPSSTVMMIATLVTNWTNAARREWIGYAAILFFINLIATAAFFLPRGVIPLMVRAGEGMSGDEITRMAKTWIFCDWIRLACVFAMFFLLARAARI